MTKRKTQGSLSALAEELVGLARKAGADEAEVSVSDGREFSVDVRLGQVENLVEAGARHLSFRVIKDMKTAYASTSDLSEDTVKRLIRNAVRRAEMASRDEFASLPSLAAQGIDVAGLRLFDPELAAVEAGKKISLALETERVGLEDKRITNSHGASFVSSEGTTILANSLGFSGAYDQTFCSLSVGLQAGETDLKAEDYWYSASRFFRELEAPEAVGRRAVERTVRQLNPRKIKTQTVPVVFEPDMTAWLVGFLFACVSGVAVYQRASFLADRLGSRIGNEKVSVIDDGLMPGRLGSRPFDGEAVACRKTVVVEGGVLRRFLCNAYAARKLKLETTGNGDGTGVSPNNFYLAPGPQTPEDIIASTDRGLILTRTIGHGLNPVTGDISRGAFGLWVEGGRVAYPVAEITIAGHLEQVLNGIEAVGNDLDFRTPVCGPTIRVAGLIVAGE
jgi:PmbA protein